MMTPVASLIPGDVVDLYGDRFADPEHDHVSLEYEYEVVWRVERETQDCVCAYFGFDAVGFPPDHEVLKIRHDEGYEE